MRRQHTIIISQLKYHKMTIQLELMVLMASLKRCPIKLKSLKDNNNNSNKSSAIRIYSNYKMKEMLLKGDKPLWI